MEQLIIDYNPAPSVDDTIRQGILSYNQSKTEEFKTPLSVFLKNKDEKMLGGIKAALGKQSIYIEFLWIDESCRKKGLGTKILLAAEAEAKKQGCLFSTLDTYSFQAEPFYLKMGYERIGEVKNYWYEHSRIFLRKRL